MQYPCLLCICDFHAFVVRRGFGLPGNGWFLRRDYPERGDRERLGPFSRRRTLHFTLYLFGRAGLSCIWVVTGRTPGSEHRARSLAKFKHGIVRSKRAQRRGTRARSNGLASQTICAKSWCGSHTVVPISVWRGAVGGLTFLHSCILTFLHLLDFVGEHEARFRQHFFHDL